MGSFSNGVLRATNPAEALLDSVEDLDVVSLLDLLAVSDFESPEDLESEEDLDSEEDEYPEVRDLLHQVLNIGIFVYFGDSQQDD